MNLLINCAHFQEVIPNNLRKFAESRITTYN